MEEVARAAGVHVDTLYTWQAGRPDFADAIKSAKCIADDLVEASLFRRACGYSHRAIKFFCHEGKIVSQEYDEHYPPDLGSMVFWLKNRRPKRWRDVQRHQVEAQEPITIAYKSKAEREAEAKAKAEKNGKK